MATSVLIIVSCLLSVAYSAGYCKLHHNGCDYKLVLSGKDCPMQSDISKRLKTSADDTDEAWENYIIENDIPIKRIDALEARLLKMMEGISVRSLRHIRQIRSELRDVSQSISSLKVFEFIIMHYIHIIILAW